MSLLLLMFITTAFWVVPTDCMDKLTESNVDLSEIFEELASEEEIIRNQGAYKMLQYFTNQNPFQICIEKATDFLNQISFAIKDNVIRSEVNGKWICAKEIPSKVKQALKVIQGRSFKRKRDKNYPENIKNQFLMILSVAVRICAMIGPNNELQAFLTAYKCSSEDQSQTPPIMYSFDILPNYSNDNIGKLGHSTSEISSIRLNKDISAESKQNFNFLLKLSEIELTPFAILDLSKKIESALSKHRTNINIEHPAIYDLVIAHFYREYEAISSSYQVDFKHSDYCNLTNFMLQLMNRVQESPNLSEYFVNAKFSTELEQKLEKFHQLENEYEYYCKNYVSNDIKEHQDFLHFAEAVHVNWNPYKELLITLQNFDHVDLCVQNGLETFTAAIRDVQAFLYKLVKMLQDKKLQTLENFVEIEQNCNKLKELDELFDAGKGTKSDKTRAFDLIVTLNAELEKAKKFCMEKIW